MLNEATLADNMVFLTRWLGSLQSARQERRMESVPALRQIFIAAKETAEYLAEVQASGKADAKIEARLARGWTKLSHLMGNMGNAGLAKRCLVKGGLWADASTLSAEYITQASTALREVEKLAESTLAQLGG